MWLLVGVIPSLIWPVRNTDINNMSTFGLHWIYIAWFYWNLINPRYKNHILKSYFELSRFLKVQVGFHFNVQTIYWLIELIYKSMLFFFKLLLISQVLLISKAREYFLYSFIKSLVQNKTYQNFQWWAIVAGVVRINISKIGPGLKERFRSFCIIITFLFFFLKGSYG